MSFRSSTIVWSHNNHHYVFCLPLRSSERLCCGSQCFVSRVALVSYIGCKVHRKWEEFVMNDTLHVIKTVFSLLTAAALVLMGRCWSLCRQTVCTGCMLLWIEVANYPSLFPLWAFSALTVLNWMRREQGWKHVPDSMTLSRFHTVNVDV